MVLLVIWIIYIIFVSTSQELSQLYYLLSSGFMLGFTCLYNQMNFVDFSLRSVIGFLSLPSILFWYVAFVYNAFLSLTPIECEAFVHLAFLYLYVILYICCECSHNDCTIALLKAQKRFLNKLCSKIYYLVGLKIVLSTTNLIFSFH
jgi:hypothetical protein